MKSVIIVFILFAFLSSTRDKYEIMEQQVDKNFLLGQFIPSSRTDFVKVAYPYTDKTNMYLQLQAFQAYQKMFDAAKKEGIELNVISSTRTFEQQKAIWESKWSGKTSVNGNNLRLTLPDPKQRALEILKYSSMPGTSRHHWGTEVDLNSLSASYFNSGKGKKEYDWLCKNSATYGFSQPYKGKGVTRDNGYEDEPWHWSYTPLSCKFLNHFVTQITYKDLTGFEGNQVAQSLGIIENYVQGVDKSCKCK